MELATRAALSKKGNKRDPVRMSGKYKIVFRLVGVQKPHFTSFFFFNKVFGRTWTAFQRFPPEDIKDKVTELQTKEKRRKVQIKCATFYSAAWKTEEEEKNNLSLSPVFFYTSSFISTMEATHPTHHHHHHPPPRTGHMTHLPCLLFNSMQMSNLGHDNHALARPPARPPARSPHCLEHPSHSTARGAFHRLKPRV